MKERVEQDWLAEEQVGQVGLERKKTSVSSTVFSFYILMQIVIFFKYLNISLHFLSVVGNELQLGKSALPELYVGPSHSPQESVDLIGQPLEVAVGPSDHGPLTARQTENSKFKIVNTAVIFYCFLTYL